MNLTVYDKIVMGGGGCDFGQEKKPHNKFFNFIKVQLILFRKPFYMYCIVFYKNIGGGGGGGLETTAYKIFKLSTTHQNLLHVLC